jgi:hypothetical protein
VRKRHLIQVIGATGAKQNRTTWTGVMCGVAGRFCRRLGLHCDAYRRERARADRRHSVHAVLTELLDRSVLYGVLAEIEGLGLDVLEVCQLTRTAKHQDQVTPAHRDDR